MKIDTSAAGLLQGKQAANEDLKLKKACKDFEAVLVSYMLDQMRNTIEKTGLFGSEKEEDMFQGMLNQEIAKEISNGGSIGIADLMYAQLSRQNR